MSDNLNLKFQRQDVECLSRLVKPNTFDLIVDIESSFFYPNKMAFLREVSQALKPDGSFLYGAMMFKFQ